MWMKIHAEHHKPRMLPINQKIVEMILPMGIKEKDIFVHVNDMGIKVGWWKLSVI
jgi:hypothetical protein